MNATCATCGAVVSLSPSVPGMTASGARSPEEMLGRQFFGLPQETPLCPECTGEILQVGQTLWEADLGSVCPRCRTAMAGRGADPRVSEGAWRAASGADPRSSRRGARA